MLVHFLVNEGYVNEAVKILISHYEEQGKDFDYLMLLGKATSRSGEYQTAVGAYYKAYKLRPRERLGRGALFSAAFLSYQFQDYDGATRKFEEFIKKYKISGLRRDAQYHLAWIRYLKGDYRGAIQKFNDILKKKKHHRRHWRKYPVERIKYWLAMSHMRLKNNGKARELFSELQKSEVKDFYSVVSGYRVHSLLADFPVRALGSTKRGSLPVDMEFMMYRGEEDSGQTGEEDESEENMRWDEDFGENEEKGIRLWAAGDEVRIKEEEPTVTVFKNLKLQKRFDRATSFIRIGLLDWAKWEFYEIERRTKHRAYLKRLVKSYEEIGSFNRSAYISSVYLGGERYRNGENRLLWASAYPQAYKGIVGSTAEEFKVASELIWSIMRAETFFRAQAISPVGARGLMQLMPHTARKVASLMEGWKFRERQLLEPEVNIRLGGRYLKRLLTKFGGNIPLAVAAYNAGPHRVESWLSQFGKLDVDEFIEHIPFVETRNYVKKVVNNFSVYKRLYSTEKRSLAWLAQPVGVKVKEKPATRETWEPLSQ